MRRIQGLIKVTLLTAWCLLLPACAPGNIYLGDAGWIHEEDSAGVWHPRMTNAEIARITPQPIGIEPVAECETPIQDMGKCLDRLQLKQH